MDLLAYEQAVVIPSRIGPHLEDERFRSLRTLLDLGQRRRHLLDRLHSGLGSVDPDRFWRDRAGYGSRVTLLDLDTAEEATYTLLTGDVDAGARQVSLDSLLGRTLLRRRSGDEVIVAMPDRLRRFRVVSVSSLPAQLEL
jgi:transcription elongation GreA/GreB family factor